MSDGITIETLDHCRHCLMDDTKTAGCATSDTHDQPCRFGCNEHRRVWTIGIAVCSTCRNALGNRTLWEDAHPDAIFTAQR